MLDQKKTIYIPIEIKFRELISQVLLATHAASRGFRVYIGTKAALATIIKEKKQKGGIYFYKGCLPLDDMKFVDRKTDAFVVLDQEIGPVIPNYEVCIPMRFRPGTQALVDRYYTIGPLATKAARNTLKELRGKVVTTGWPRADLWRPQFKNIYESAAGRHREKFGDFLLFSSDFGFVSEKRIQGAYLQNLEIGNPHLEKVATESRDKARESYNEFQKFICLLKIWDQDPEVPPIIVRPHPAEDVDCWRAALNGFKKTIPFYEGDIAEWIYSAIGVLHRGCTSGVQSYISGVPAAYIIVERNCVRFDLPYKLSRKIQDTCDLKKWLKDIENLTEDSLCKGADSKDGVHELNSRVLMSDYLSVEQIVDDLEDLVVEVEDTWDTHIFVAAKVRAIVIKRRVTGFFTTFLKSKTGIKNRYQIPTVDQKVPGGITVDEVERVLKLISASDDIHVQHGGIVNAVMVEKK